MSLFTRAAGSGLLVCTRVTCNRRARKTYQPFFRWLTINSDKKFQTGSVMNSVTPKSTNKRNCVSFDMMMTNRQDQAQRSVLVQVHSGLSYQDLNSYCKQFGKVQDTLYYTTSDDMHFILIEFETKESAVKLLNSASYGSTIPAVPVSSPFLWFRATERGSRNLQSNTSLPQPLSDAEPSATELQKLLQEADSVSEQMRILHESTCLGDLGSRLRFLTARQIEMALSGMFPHIRALPFGSSVNGFGRAGCDLDMVLQLGGQEEGQVDEQKSRSRLMFHGKGSAACNGRVQLQRHMETIADMLHLFLPGCSRVVRILQARVPIIKFRHDLAMLECDLSMTNMTAVHMSELLYILGETDKRVRPLVFCVRRWAQAVGLTNPTPGRWVTNFSLTLLTLFYLQTCSKPVIPSLGTLIQLAGEKDRRITADGVNCTFLRELSNLALSSNQENLEELFIGFFEFYSKFDFASRGISLVSGKPLLKPDHSPLYIENPLERSLNVSKNVSADETLRLQIELRNAAWFLEQQEEEEPRKGPNWGLLALFSSAKAHGLESPKAKAYRLVHVKDLFNDDKSSIQHYRTQKSLRHKRR